MNYSVATMIQIETFSELLELLYSALLQEEQWQHFLARLSDLTGSSIGFFLVANTRFGHSIRAHGGPFHGQILQSDIQTYNDEYTGRDPLRAPTLRQGRPGVFQTEDLMPVEAYCKTDLYRDLTSSYGLRYGSIMLLNASVRRLEVISLWRTQKQGPMPPGHIRLLELLLPHIQLALEVRQALGVRCIADSSDTPTFLLARDGHVVHKNAAAERMLQKGDALTLRNDRLLGINPTCRDALRQLLTNAAESTHQGSASLATRALALPRSGSRRPLHLLASPLAGPQSIQTGADVLLLVTDPETVPSFPDHELADLYQFTPAEVEVANGLLMGYSLPEIASVRRVSTGTVRNQVKSIFAKTSTSKQSEFVQLLMTLPKVGSYPALSN